MSRRMSSPVITAYTPSSESAALGSMLRILPCGTELRVIFPYSIPGNVRLWIYSALPSTLDLLSSRRTERLTWRVGGVLRSVFGGGSIIFAIVLLSPARGECAPAPSHVCRRRSHEGRRLAPVHQPRRPPLSKTRAGPEARQPVRLRPQRRASGVLSRH